MAEQVEESLSIAAPPSSVFPFLLDLRTWRMWWPGLHEAATLDHKPLREGAKFLLHVQPTWLSFRTRPTVETVTANRSLIWVSRGLLLTTRHAFYLEQREAGTKITERQTFDGPGVLFLRLTRQLPAIHEMCRQNLRGLRKLVETAG